MMEETFSAAGRTIRMIRTLNGINVYMGVLLVLALTTEQAIELSDKIKILCKYKETKRI
jgi:hypothetical protein